MLFRFAGRLRHSKIVWFINGRRTGTREAMQVGTGTAMPTGAGTPTGPGTPTGGGIPPTGGGIPTTFGTPIGAVIWLTDGSETESATGVGKEVGSVSVADGVYNFLLRSESRPGNKEMYDICYWTSKSSERNSYRYDYWVL